jgi:hypothetical protein
MSSTRLIRYSLVTLGLALFFGCNSKIETNNFQHNLKFVESIGSDESEAYITRSRSISSDLQNYIYVADQGLAKVHQYTLNGDYIKSIGRSGRGPGEFSGNMNVHAEGDSLLVTDFTNLSVSLFNADGELLNTFNLEDRHTSEFQFFNRLLVTGHSYSLPLGTEYKDEDLLYLYDVDGKINHSFGEFLDFEESVPSIIQKNFTAVSGDLLHLVFMFFPLYHIYNDRGELVESFQIDEIISHLNTENNSQLDSTNDYLDARITGLKGKIGGLFISGERIFLPLANDSLLRIDELNYHNSEMKHLQSYSYPLNDGTRNVIGYIDFFFSEKENSFYILENEENEGFVVAKYLITDG